MITLHTGDCLAAPWRSKRNAWITDPPANIAFMGRKWDKYVTDLEFVPPIPPPASMSEKEKRAWIRELKSEFAFQLYWGERFRLMYDQSEDDAVAFVWALPRTAHLTQTALRWAGWRILDSWHHAFGQGWNKNGGHLKPAHEVWFVALKGKPELNIDAGRVKRGNDKLVRPTGKHQTMFVGLGQKSRTKEPLGSHPPNFALSHHVACIQIGERKVKGEKPRALIASNETGGYSGGRRAGIAGHTIGGNADGTESLPAYSCAVSCPCGRHWIELSGGSPGKCECGRQGEWVCPVAELDEQSGNRPGMTGGGKHRPGAKGGMFGAIDCETSAYGDQGGASRFFPTFGYYAKASGRVDDDGVPRGERHAGCEELYWRANKDNPFGFDRVTREEWEVLPSFDSKDARGRDASVTARPLGKARGNVHPTVKAIEMMMYLAKLSGGTKIGDLCFGSGGTAIACQLLGLDFEGAELCPEAVEITRMRLAFWSGLSLHALENFKLTGELPQPVERDPRNLSLF